MIQRQSLITTAALALLTMALSTGCNKQPPGRTISAPTPGGETPAVEAPADKPEEAKADEAATATPADQPDSGAKDGAAATGADASGTAAPAGDGVEEARIVNGEKIDPTLGPVVVVDGQPVPAGGAGDGASSDTGAAGGTSDNPRSSGGDSGNGSSGNGGATNGDDTGAPQAAGSGVTITVGQAAGEGSITLPVYVAGSSAASVQFQLIYDTTQVEITGVVATGAATAANKQVMTKSFGEQGVMRVVVFGMNRNIISDGTLVNVTVRPKVSGQVAPIAIGGLSAAAPDASAVAVTGVAGQVTIH